MPAALKFVEGLEAPAEVAPPAAGGQVRQAAQQSVVSRGAASWQLRLGGARGLRAAHAPPGSSSRAERKCCLQEGASCRALLE